MGLEQQPDRHLWRSPRALNVEFLLTSATFADLGVMPAITDALDAVGIKEPFPIQTMCIPLALDGQDLIGQAKTGTGKTLGFGVPLLQHIQAPADIPG